jgi:hypothetical protein
MRDIRKFDLTVRQSTRTMLNKRELAYEVFAEAIRRGVSPERLRALIPAWKIADVEGHVDEYEFIRRARKVYAETGRSFDPTRFYTADSKLMKLKGRTYAFSNQWGTSTLEMVNRMIREMRATDIHYDARS